MVLFSRAPRAYTAHGFGTSSGAPPSGHNRSSLVATHARRGDARPSRGALDEHAARRREPPLPALAPLLLQARSAQRGRAVAAAVGSSCDDEGGRGREREVRQRRDARLGRRRRHRAPSAGTESNDQRAPRAHASAAGAAAAAAARSDDGVCSAERGNRRDEQRHAELERGAKRGVRQVITLPQRTQTQQPRGVPRGRGRCAQWARVPWRREGARSRACGCRAAERGDRDDERVSRPARRLPQRPRPLTLRTG